MSKIKDTIEEKDNKVGEEQDFAYWEHLRDLDNEKIQYDKNYSKCCDDLIVNSRCSDCKEGVN